MDDIYEHQEKGTLLLRHDIASSYRIREYTRSQMTSLALLVLLSMAIYLKSINRKKCGGTLDLEKRLGANCVPMLPIPSA